MNTKTSQQTEILFEQLFSGVSALREQALLAVDPKDRDGIREAVKVRKDGCALWEMLMTDLGSAGGELRKNYVSQFWRRTAIRALAATVEGIVFSLKRLAVATTTTTLVGTKLDDEEMEFLKEQAALTGKKTRLPGFRDNS
jgi:Arc/MetJ family transcription regulator